MSEVVVFKGEDGKLSGTRFGMLVALRKSRQAEGRDWWLCRCDCGTEKEVVGKSLRCGLTKSCGCGIAKAAADRAKHAYRNHPLFSVYKNIIARTTNPNSADFRNYGGRGITFQFSSPDAFVEWAIAAGWKPGLTVDRRNNDGPYSSDNCRLITMAEQTRNTRRNRLVNVDGEQLCFKDAAARLGVNYLTAMSRLKRGMSTEEALGLGAP